MDNKTKPNTTRHSSYSTSGRNRGRQPPDLHMFTDPYGCHKLCNLHFKVINSWTNYSLQSDKTLFSFQAIANTVYQVQEILAGLLWLTYPT